MRGSTRLLVLVACMSFLALMYVSTRRTEIPTAQSDPTEDLYKPTVDVTAAYLNATPFPVESPTPIDPAVGEYVGWSISDIADDVVAKLEHDGVADTPTTVVLTRDVVSTSTQRIADPALIAYSGDPDVAIILSGTFHADLAFDASRTADTLYMLLLVDRISGSISAKFRSNDLASLQAMLPPP
jgi:hypothetical protein